MYRDSVTQSSNYQVDDQTFPTLNANHSVYRDAVPLPSASIQINIIHSSEAVVRNVGGVREELADWSPPDDHEFALAPDGKAYNQALEANLMDPPPPLPVQKKKKRNRTMVTRRPHVVWMVNHRQNYLDEILRWEGRGDFLYTTFCPDCLSRKVHKPSPPEFRCRECFLPDLTCLDCCVKRHRQHRFHKIQKWTGESFVEVSLRSMGLEIQLNHASGRCDSPVPCHSGMLVLHTNGIHSIDIQYCGCHRALPNHSTATSRPFSCVPNFRENLRNIRTASASSQARAHDQSLGHR